MTNIKKIAFLHNYFPTGGADKVTINIYGYFEKGERMEIRREVFSNIHAEKIDLKGGEFLPLKLPSGTIIRLSEKDNGCVIVGGNPDS